MLTKIRRSFIEKVQEKNALCWVLILSMFCICGYYEWGFAIIGTIICIASIVKVFRQKKVFYYKDPYLLGIIGIFLGTILSVIGGIDSGMAFFGVLRFLPVVVWVFLNMQYEDAEREIALQTIPFMGCVMVGISLISLLISDWSEYFWTVQRMGGFFEYPNTCAVFLLIGMTLLPVRMRKRDILMWSILFWGIMLTGSRAVMLLMVVVILYQFFSGNRLHKIMIGIHGVVAVAAGVTVVFLTGNIHNIARLATLISSGSTYIGRLLYWIDAIPIIKDHPFGLGYMGYSYVQTAYQTGVYKTVYAHNDFLQMFLDNGWIAGVLFLSLCIYELMVTKHKLATALLILHGLMDFDLQYLSMLLVLVLLFPWERTKEGMQGFVCTIKKWKGVMASVGCIGILLCYFFFPAWLWFRDEYYRAVCMYPWYTTAKESLLNYTADLEESEQLCEDILSQNAYSVIAYNRLTYNGFENGDLEKFVVNKWKVIMLCPYRISEFNHFVRLLEEYPDKHGENWTEEEMAQYEQYCSNMIDKIEIQLKEAEKTTSSLAYKITEKPRFQLSGR